MGPNGWKYFSCILKNQICLHSSIITFPFKWVIKFKMLFIGGGECWTVGGHTAFQRSKSRSWAQNGAGDKSPIAEVIQSSVSYTLAVSATNSSSINEACVTHLLQSGINSYLKYEVF